MMTMKNPISKTTQTGDNEYSVLDNGYVHLVDWMGDDLTVVNSARVSFSKESDWEEQDGLTFLSIKDEKLIRYLAKHNHWTPFAHPQITMRIKAPISIRTQFFKHKQGFVENEISRRYVTSEPEIYFPIWRGAPTDGAKQGSSDFILNSVNAIEYTERYTKIAQESIRIYNSLIESGVAPEQARFVLPQGTYTEWYWTGSLAAYARFYKQRIDPHAQWEIRQYAEVIGALIAPKFPISWEVLTS